MRMLFSCLALGALALPASAALAQEADETSKSLFLRAEKVIVRPGHALEPGQVLVRDGKIVAVGQDLDAPEGATEISGRVVCAGFLDPWSALSVSPASLGETSTNMATRTSDAVDLWLDEHLRREALEAGVTSARCQGGIGAPLAGIGVALRLSGSDRDSAMLLEDATGAANVGLSREGGGSFQRMPDGSFQFISGPQPVDPFARLSQIDRLLGELEAGRKYAEDMIEYRYELEEWQKAIDEKTEELEKDFKKAKKKRDKDKAKAEEDGKEFKEEKYKEDKKPKAPKFNAIREWTGRIANGEIPLVVQVHRSAEIRALLEGTERFDRLRMIIAGGTEAVHSAEALADRKIPVMVLPALLGQSGWGGYDEWSQHDLTLAAQLSAKGVSVLLGSGGNDPRATRDLPLMASLAVGHGLDREKALEALTLGAAQAMDVADRVGSVELGKDAELIVLDGEPLVSTTRVQYVVSNGDVVVSPEN